MTARMKTIPVITSTTSLAIMIGFILMMMLVKESAVYPYLMGYHRSKISIIYIKA